MKQVTLDILQSSIVNSLADRFILEQGKPLPDKLYSKIGSSRILRVKRAQNLGSSFRTILLCEIDNASHYDTVLNWAYDVRDVLVNDESSDLYLFFIISEDQLNIEVCVNIEANEDCCRKYVFHPDESVEDFLNRTFLHQHTNDNKLESISDPLLTALTKTGESFSFLDSTLQNKWREALLSVWGGADIADILLED
ncbi:MAG: hypothetical protein JWO06_3941 [Bacteroidota bacterium]|nr:hypothetical protein [Bacteroidota bacterium]